jgi:hypothetical protein
MHPADKAARFASCTSHPTQWLGWLFSRNDGVENIAYDATQAFT